VSVLGPPQSRPLTRLGCRWLGKILENRGEGVESEGSKGEKSAAGTAMSELFLRKLAEPSSHWPAHSDS
jgi:hypothetical protein